MLGIRGQAYAWMAGVFGQGALMYLAAMTAIFVGQRLVDGHEQLQGGMTGLGVVVLAMAAWSRFRRLRRAHDEGLRLAHRLGLMFLLVGCASLVMYAATTEGVVRSMTMGEEAESRWLGVWRSLWPVVWLLGTIPLLVVDYAVTSSPVMMPVRRVRDLLTHGLVAAMGLALVFPVNYIASQEKERWDLAYFKTPTPGTATQAVAAAVEAPIDVRIFMPPSSEVAQELLDYFSALEGPNLRVEVIDQAAEPRLAKALAVRDNGVVTFTQGEVILDEPEPEPEPQGEEGEDAEPKDDTPRPVTRTIRVAPEIDKAKRTLAKIDAEVQRVLIELGHGERIAYLTTGHGELTWKGQTRVLDRQMKWLHQRLKDLGFTIKELGVTQNLAEKVPDDADLVMVLGPQAPFLPGESESLRRYLDAGGSVLVAMEPRIVREGSPRPGPDPLEDFIEGLGVSLGEGVLAAEANILPIANNKLDRLNIATNSFTSHASSQEVAAGSSQLFLFSPAAGYLEEVEQPQTDVTFTARSLAITWADLNLNAEFDADEGESKAARNLVAAITGGTEAGRWRAIVTSDASMFSDLAAGSRGNQLLIEGSINWLIGAEALSGTTKSEEDIKVEHTKEGQTTWFYLTVLAVPLGVMGLGALRVQFRHRDDSRATARSNAKAPAVRREPVEAPTGESSTVSGKIATEPDGSSAKPESKSPAGDDRADEKGGDR